MTNAADSQPPARRPSACRAFCLALAALPAAAIATDFRAIGSSPDCFDAAAAHHRVNPWLLRAIAKHESGGRAAALGKNTNGSQDWGLMQINTQHLPLLERYGVSRQQVWDACTNVFLGAWVLRSQVDAHGNTWTAVGAYNSSLPARRAWYASQIQAIIQKWQRLGLIPPGEI